MLSTLFYFGLLRSLLNAPVITRDYHGSQYYLRISRLKLGLGLVCAGSCGICREIKKATHF